jgi:hypothetical protein
MAKPPTTQGISESKAKQRKETNHVFSFSDAPRKNLLNGVFLP